MNCTSKVTVIESDAHSYYLAVDGEWAKFFVQEGVRNDGKTHYGYLSIISSFGTFGHCFSHMSLPLPAFLQRTNFDYVMEKLHPKSRIFDWDKAIEKIKKEILTVRRESPEGISKKEAREFWDSIVDFESDYGSFEHFLNKLAECAGRFWDDWSMWEDSEPTVPNPQCVGFWNTFWKPFLEVLSESREVA